MMFDHEHVHSPIHAPQGPAPLWCQVAFWASLIVLTAIATHKFWSKLL